SLKKAFEALPSYIQRFKQLSFFVKNAHLDLTLNQEHQSLAIIVNTANGFEEYNRDVIIDQKLQSQLNAFKDELNQHVSSIALGDDAKAVVLYQLLKEYLYPIGE